MTQLPFCLLCLEKLKLSTYINTTEYYLTSTLTVKVCYKTFANLRPSYKLSVTSMVQFI